MGEWKLVVVSSPLSRSKASDSPQLETFAAVEVPSKCGGPAMSILKGFPLSAEYGHLKRIRRAKADNSVLQILLAPLREDSKWKTMHAKLKDALGYHESSPLREGTTIKKRKVGHNDTEPFTFSQHMNHSSKPNTNIVEVLVPYSKAATQDKAKEWTNKYWPNSFMVASPPAPWADESAQIFADDPACVQQVEQYLRIARNEAELAIASGCKFNTCVAVHASSGDIIEVARDKASDRSPLGHAAMELITQICTRITKAKLDPAQQPGHVGKESYLLTGFCIFCVWEPCMMCAMALLHSRIDRLVFEKVQEAA